MPKRRSTAATQRARRSSPYARCSPSIDEHQLSPEEEQANWDDVRCPVCMEHPHNAVLLICSSHANGCRPFMCNTSHRHSNCLDQYRKAAACSPDAADGGQCRTAQERLTCPLCRGIVCHWTIDEAARRCMNSKSRGCSVESCEFTGAYRDLRMHARSEHPLARPSEADPERQRAWRRMEQQWDFGDLMSMLRAGVSSARVEGPDLAAGADQPGVRTITMVIFVRPSGATVRVMSSTASGGGSSRTTRRARRLLVYPDEGIESETYDLFSDEEDTDIGAGDPAQDTPLVNATIRFSSDDGAGGVEAAARAQDEGDEGDELTNIEMILDTVPRSRRTRRR